MKKHPGIILILFAITLLAAAYAMAATPAQELKIPLTITVPPGYFLMIYGTTVKTQKLDATAIYSSPENGVFKKADLISSTGELLSGDSGCAYYYLAREAKAEGVKATAGVRLEDRTGGARVQSVMPMSPADQAGMTAGMWITAVNGTPVKNVTDAVTQIRGLSVDQSATISVVVGDRNTGETKILHMTPRAMFGTGVIKLGRLVPDNCNYEGKTSMNCNLSLSQVTESSTLFWGIQKADLPAFTVSFNMEWSPKMGLQVRLSPSRPTSAWDAGEKTINSNTKPTQGLRFTALPAMFELRTDRVQGLKLTDGTLVDGEFIVDRLDCLVWKKHFAGSTTQVNLNSGNLYDLENGKPVLVRLICSKGDLAAGWLLSPRK